MKRYLVLVLIVLIGISLGFPSGKKINKKMTDIKGLNLNVDLKSNPHKKLPGNVAKPDIDFGKIPLYFVTNRGQVNKKAKFYAKASRYTLWLTKEGLVFDSTKEAEVKEKPGAFHTSQARNSPAFLRDVSRLMFLNANKNPVMVPIEEAKLEVNYFKGNDKSKWHGAVPTSKAVLYKSLYKNIDLKVYGIEKEIEYDWIVKSGGDSNNIKFRYKNVKNSRIDKDGNLLVETKFGELMHKRPVSYQVIDGKRKEVIVHFKKRSKNTYGFEVGVYDRARELVIDPVVLAYSTYLGGQSLETSYAVAVDADGYVYVTGHTVSADFPTFNHYQSTLRDYDTFITKLDATQSGTASLLYSTFLGGSDYDTCNSIAVDTNGCAYVTGSTRSRDFPTLNQYQSHQGGSYDVFVTKLDTTQSGAAALLYSTCLGGTGGELGYDVAVDAYGYVYVTGNTESSDFPVRNQYMTAHGGRDVFVAKLDPASSGDSSLIFSTYLGGGSDDYCDAIAVDAGGYAYLTGKTKSSDFPILNQYQGFQGGLTDAFVVKLDTNRGGSAALIYSTCLGGGNIDVGEGIALDDNGYVYVTGTTYHSSFPTLNQYQTYQGDYDAFVTKLDTTQSGASSLLYSTCLGGKGNDSSYGIAIDGSGYVYVTGSTQSLNFPIINQLHELRGTSDAFVARLDTTQGGTSSLLYSTYLGGTGSDRGFSIAVDGDSNVYITGQTWSTDFPIINQYQSFQGGPGRYDAFVTKLSFGPSETISLTTPNGGEEWAAGSLRDIAWNATGVSGSLKITLWKDGQLVGNIADNIVASAVTYPWTVGMYSGGVAAPGTGYTIQIEENGSAVSDSSDTVFSIITLPTVTTAEVTNITADTARGGGSISSNGFTVVTERGVCWNIESTPTIAHHTVHAGSGTGSFTGEISGLLPGVVYYARAYAINLAGTAYGNEVSFKTLVPLPADERAFLVDFYNATGGDSWDDNDGWKTGLLGTDGFGTPGSEEQWNGVVTGLVNGEKHLLQMDLKYNSLSGSIPILLRELEHIRHINLQGNALTGNIPSWIGELKSLNELTLANNDLGGTIPPELSGLTNLKILNLAGCGLSGTIPAELAALVNLEQLSLANNNITGTIPPELAAMTQLINLNLGNCNLDAGPIPSWIANLAKLQYLLLYGNNFNGSIPAELSNLLNLKTLHLAYNQLTGSIPDVSAMSNLYKLDLSHNLFTGELLPGLGNLSKLRYLYLNNNMLSGEVPTALMNLTLHRLWLQENNGLFTDEPTLQAWLDSLNPGWDD
jgi:hypothetical protein